MIGQEKIKQFLLVDDMIVYVNDLKESNKKNPPELLIEFSKVVG